MSTPAEALATALELVHAPSTTPAQSRWKADLAFMAASALFCFVIAPQFYAWVVIQMGEPVISRIVALHIMANGCANFLVGVGSWSGRGRLDERIGRSLRSVLVSHGLLAMVVVLTHSVYSNTVMATAAAVSVVWGLGAAFAANVTTRTRIALVGPPQIAPEHLPAQVERVTDPSTDLRTFDLILTGSSDEMPAEWTRALSRAMLAGKPVRHCAEYVEEARGLVSIEHFDLDQLPAGGVASYMAGKRVLDLVLSAAALPFAAPILIVACVAIYLTMGRPIFFVQPRVGLGGMPFRMVKLRTMTEAPARLGAEGAAANATQKITPLGRWLRQLRIDELPQLWHVLVGEMSFIGPRPEWSLLAERYTAQLPVYAYRHLVRPGITGWAQVRSGYAGDLQETRLKVAYDLFYLKHFSFALDLQVLARTILTLVTTRGAR